MLISNNENIGDFQNENGLYYTYRKTSNPWALSHGLYFEIDVLDGVRFGIVKKTRAYIAIDEDSEGEPVLEFWYLKRNNQYAI